MWSLLASVARGSPSLVPSQGKQALVGISPVAAVNKSTGGGVRQGGRNAPPLAAACP